MRIVHQNSKSSQQDNVEEELHVVYSPNYHALLDLVKFFFHRRQEIFVAIWSCFYHWRDNREKVYLVPKAERLTVTLGCKDSNLLDFRLLLMNSLRHDLCNSGDSKIIYSASMLLTYFLEVSDLPGLSHCHLVFTCRVPMSQESLMLRPFLRIAL